MSGIINTIYIFVNNALGEYENVDLNMNDLF